jgi:hypothetical protein
MPKPSSLVSSAPHSWDIENWPADVYPHTRSRAKYLVRAYRNELILAGALTRVGRELVIFGEGYTRFLQRRSTHVPNYSLGDAVRPEALRKAERSAKTKLAEAAKTDTP